jgi:hypothetical protein
VKDIRFEPRFRYRLAPAGRFAQTLMRSVVSRSADAADLMEPHYLGLTAICCDNERCTSRMSVLTMPGVKMSFRCEQNGPGTHSRPGAVDL